MEKLKVVISKTCGSMSAGAGHNHASLHIKYTNQACQANSSLLEALNAKVAIKPFIKEQINYSRAAKVYLDAV